MSVVSMQPAPEDSESFASFDRMSAMRLRTVGEGWDRNSIRFCSRCGNRVEIQIPRNDHLPRHVCPACSGVQYKNPRIIVGIIPETPEGRIVICRRAIAPREGFWTFPAGYLENGETGEQGAIREAREEAGVRTDALGLYMVINALAACEVHLVYRGRFNPPATSRARSFAHGPESAEVRAVNEDEVPWSTLSYPAVETCLHRYFADRASGKFPVHTIDVIDGHVVDDGRPSPSRGRASSQVTGMRPHVD